ncbi:DUF3100 domain-containing protein [Telmatospirillum siberiense]|uniref:DUF3100 domain-containing protein n=1 Tax=Telmatospirillum siberiense TaxID=382514 RepID=A0A2N3PXQ2_9PROT|nr:DUF3100 domain-containing protein [Telmatospirillum siberiense]PKU25155.1 DUF3100 domain-containing protein [Telmatospirillum siberiense]
MDGQNAGQGSLLPSKIRLYLLCFLIVVIAESIGTIGFQVGPGKILLMPLVWSVLLGGLFSVFSRFLPAPVGAGPETQWYGASLLQPALFLLIAKLGLLVGGSLPSVVASGWSLIFQEFGHFFGTMVFGLPVALLLGIRREAIGATFSVGREPSLAIISEKYGLDSAEGRGVLAEYLTGTVFGAVFIGLLAGFIASLNIFDPIALAMGAGVGSGSMMAAASGAIAAQQSPEVAKEVAVFAGAANLLTTTVGTYFTLFLSLPFTIWAYGVLMPVLGRIGLRERATTGGLDGQAVGSNPHKAFSLTEWVIAWFVTAVIALIGNNIGFHTAVGDALPGMAIIFATTMVGFAIFRLGLTFAPIVCWVSIVGMVLTYPGMPYATEISSWTGKISPLALITPILAYAGLSVAKDLPAFRRLGWPIIVTSFLANAGTFIGATLIAQFFRH